MILIDNSNKTYYTSRNNDEFLVRLTQLLIGHVSCYYLLTIMLHHVHFFIIIIIMIIKKDSNR